MATDVVTFLLYGAKGDIEIPIKLADEDYSTKQIAAVDFDAVIVAAPHKVTRSSEAYSDYFAGTPMKRLPARGTNP